MSLQRNEDLTYTVTCECGASITVESAWALGCSQALRAGRQVPLMRHNEPSDLCPKCAERKACQSMSDDELDAELRAEGVDVEGLLADVNAIRARANGADRPTGDA